MNVWGLASQGESINGWAFRMNSKRLFRTPEEAEAYIPAFEAKCCDKTFFEAATPGTLITVVIEYELDNE